MISRSNKGSKLNFSIETSFGNQHQSRSLPEVVGKDGQTRPDRRPCGASGQHSAEAELTFEHSDRGLMPQRNRCNCRKPPRSLMRLFFSAQTTHFRDTDFLNAGSSQAALHPRYCSSRDPQGVSWALCRDCFCLTQHPKQFRSVAGIAPVNP